MVEHVEHSPAPWKLGQEYGNSQDEIEAADGTCVCVVWTRTAHDLATARPQFKPVPKLMANARLIIRATELLKHLRKAVENHGFEYMSDWVAAEDLISEIDGTHS